MIRMGLFLTVIMVTINAGLFLFGDLDDQAAFANLSLALDQVEGFDLETGTGTDISSFSSQTTLGASVDSFLGYIDALKNVALALISIAGFLLTGSIQIVSLLDTAGAWALVILAPIAVFQLFYITFLIITIASALLGSLRGLLGG